MTKSLTKSMTKAFGPALRTMPKMSEKQFQQQVVDMARALGWMAYHTHDSRRSEPGFPDLVLVRERIIYAELKSETGKPTLEQLSWMEALKVAGAEVYLWRPSDACEIEETLKRKEL